MVNAHRRCSCCRRPLDFNELKSFALYSDEGQVLEYFNCPCGTTVTRALVEHPSDVKMRLELTGYSDEELRT